MTKILDNNFNLAKLKTLKLDELNKLATEIRAYIKNICTNNGGHLAGNLGAVELTLALHYVFNSPVDKLIFDVGHQSYTHKILTNRFQALRTLRQKNGLSGFTQPQESVHDVNVAGHAGNAISIATGLSFGSPNNCKIAIVGDGCLLNGMSIEALNHLATSQQNVLIVINDNDYSIDRCPGAIARQNQYQALIESFGLPYLGPIDGHNLAMMISAFQQMKNYSRPRVIHLKTQKGRGDQVSEQNPAQMHFYQKSKSQEKVIKLSNFIGDQLLESALKDPKIHLVTPAMSQGGGFVNFAQKLPKRFYDVGIAESHALGLSAGLALGGKKPFCHLYASFMQRAYDQLIHDVAIPQLPVTILLDRCGLVGNDGATHQGTMALNFLHLIPNLQILNPGDHHEIISSLKFAQKSDLPTIIMYPKAEIKAQNIKEIKNCSLSPQFIKKSASPVLVITTGWIKQNVTTATTDLNIDHYHLPLIKPLPIEKILPIIHQYQHLIIIEENSLIGGLGQMIRSFAPANLSFTHLTLPDQFITHASREEQLEQVGLDIVSLRRQISQIISQYTYQANNYQSLSAISAIS